MAARAKQSGRGRAKTAIAQGSWRAPQIAPVVLVSGPEDFFASEAVASIRAQLRDADPALETSEIDASSYAPGELSTLVSPSLFMEPRLVVCEHVHECANEFLQEALDYVANPVESTVVVLRHESGVRGKKLLDLVRANAGFVEINCVTPKAHELHEFVVTEFRAQQRRIQPQAAASLVAAFNTDVAELAAACRQLMALSDDREISAELVERYYGGRVETTGFKIADATIAGQLAQALSLVRAGFDTGVNPVPIVAAIAMKLRLMAKVAGLAGTDAQLASQVGAAPWQVGQARRDLSGFTEVQLGHAIMLCAETDHMVKGLSRDPEFAVERLVRKVAAREL